MKVRAGARERKPRDNRGKFEVLREWGARLHHTQSRFFAAMLDTRVIPPDTFLQNVMRDEKVTSLFSRLAAVSPRWQQLVHPPLQIDLHDDLDTFDSTLVRALEYGVPAAALPALAHQLESYPIAEKFTDPSQLEKVAGIFSHQYAKSEDKDLKKVIKTWSKRHERPFLAAVHDELDRFIAMDFASLSSGKQDERIKNVFKLIQIQNTYVSEGSGDQPERVHQWFERVKSLTKGRKIEGRGAIEFQLEGLRASSIEPLAGDRTVRIEKLPLRLRVYIKSPWLDVFLNDLSVDDVMQIVNSLSRTTLASDQVEVLSQLIHLPSQTIQSIGPTRELIDAAIRQGLNEDDLYKRSKDNSNLKEAITELYLAFEANLYRLETILASLVTKKLLVENASLDQLDSIVAARKALATASQTVNAIRSASLKPYSLSLSTYNEEADTLIAVLLRHEDAPFARWAETYSNIVQVKKLTPELMPLSVRQELSRIVTKQISAMSPTERRKYIHSRQILKLLPIEVAAGALSDDFLAATSRRSLNEKAHTYEHLRQELNLPTDLPDLDLLLRQTVAERMRLQPGEIATFFKPDESTLAQAIWIRGMSGLIAEVQALPVADQIEILNYVSGRSDKVPQNLSTAQTNDENSKVDTGNLLALLRTRLMRVTHLERTLALLPFFMGDTSLLEKSNGQEVLLTEILKSVSLRHQSLARKLAKGMLQAEGRAKGLSYANCAGNTRTTVRRCHIPPGHECCR